MKKFAIATLSASIALAASASFAAPAYKGENFKGEMGAPIAAPCPVEKSLKDGFYLGANVGYDAYRIRQSGNYALAGVPGGQFGANTSNSVTGVNGGLFLGYAQDLSSNFRLGGEIFANRTGADNTYRISNLYTNKLEARGGYGLSILPGVKVSNDALLYAKVGYVRTQFKSVEGVSGQASASHRSWQNAVAYGLGMEMAATDNVSIRGEYTYAKYNSWRSPINTRFSPSNNSFNLGVVYHFA